MFEKRFFSWSPSSENNDKVPSTPKEQQTARFTTIIVSRVSSGMESRVVGFICSKAWVCRQRDMKITSAEARMRRTRKNTNFPMLSELTQLLIQGQW